MDQFSPLLVLLAKIAYWIAVGLGLSLLLSFITPRVVAILAQLGEILLRLRQHVVGNLIASINSRIRDSWSQQATEPRAPVAAELAQVADAINAAGVEQVARLENVQRGLAHHTEALRVLAFGSTASAASTAEGLEHGVQKVKESFWFTAILLIMVIAFGGTNAFLLQLFFRDTLGQHRLLPYPFPDFEVSHALAMLIALMEVGAGIALHYRRSEDNESATSRVFGMAPWFAIVGLLMIETVAYAILSVNMHLAASLQIAETSPMYPIVQYALAFFGAGITIILSALGFRLWSSWQDYLAGRRDTVVLRELGSYSRSMKDAGGVMVALGARLDELKRIAASLQVDVVKAFARSIGATPDRESIAAVLHTHAERFDPTASAVPPMIGVRTRGQMVADLCVNLLLLILWAVLLYLNAASVISYVAGLGAGPTAIAVGEGWVVALSISLFGFLVKDAHLASHYSSVSASSIPDRRGRRVLMYLAGIGFVIGAIIDAAVAVLGNKLGNNSVVNFGYGVFIALALALVSFNLDAALLAAVHAITLLLFGLALIGLYLYLLVSLVFEGAVYLIGQVMRLLSAPGDWLRRLRPEAV